MNPTIYTKDTETKSVLDEAGCVHKVSSESFALQGQLFDRFFLLGKKQAIYEKPISQNHCSRNVLTKERIHWCTDNQTSNRTAKGKKI